MFRSEDRLVDSKELYNKFQAISAAVESFEHIRKELEENRLRIGYEERLSQGMCKYTLYYKEKAVVRIYHSLVWGSYTGSRIGKEDGWQKKVDVIYHDAVVSRMRK